MSAPFLFLYRVFKKRKVLFGAILLVILGFAGNQAFQLDLEEDIRALLPQEEEMEGLRELASGADNQMIFKVGPKSDTTDLHQDSLIRFSDAFVEELREAFHPELISRIRYEVSDSSVRSLFDPLYQHLPIFLEPEDYERLDSLTRPDVAEERIEKNYRRLLTPAGMGMKEFILKDPVGIAPMVYQKLEKLNYGEALNVEKDRIVDSSGKHLFFFATPVHPPNESRKNAELVHGVHRIADSLNSQQDRFHVDYFGATPVSVANAERIKSDIMLTVGIASVALLLLVAFFYKRLSYFLLIFIPLLFGGGVALALLSLLKGSVSAISLGIGAVLLGIGIDFALHFLTHYRNSGSMTRSIKDLSTPILMSALTTASAFFCLLFLRSPALHDLGLFAGVSVIVSALMALWILPQFAGKEKKEKAGTSGSHILERIAGYPFHRNKALVIGVLLFTGLSAYTYHWVGFDEDLSRMNYMPEHLKGSEERIREVSSTANRAVRVISSGSDLEEALERDGELVDEIDELEAQGDLVESVRTGEFLVPTALQEERIQRWERFWDGERREKLLSLLERKREELGVREGTFDEFRELIQKKHEAVPPEEMEGLIAFFEGDFLSEGADETRVTSLLKLSEDSEVSELLGPFADIEGVSVVDEEYLATEFILLLKEDFTTLVNLSLGVVFLILLIAFGRLELTLITFIPMLMGWLWTVGIMGMIGIEFNIFNIVICTLVFGLGIDYSIFITRGHVQDFKYGFKELFSYKTSILLSALTTILGLGVLLLAEHPALRSIAAMSVIGILSVVLVAFTIQPLIFDWAVLSRKRKGHPPVSFLNFLISIVVFIVFLFGCLFMTLVGAIFLFPPYKRRRRRKLFYHRIFMGICRFVIYFPVHIRKRIQNESGEDFQKPALILSNHQSHIDLPLILMMHPKLIVLTTDWVWKNPFYGAIVRLCDFYPVSWGHDRLAELLEDKVKDGYSVLVFPEGTRSPDQRIQRFHKGGFYLAEKLGLDILPVLLHGPGDVMPKGDNHLKRGRVTLRILQRIEADADGWGKGYREKSKKFREFYRQEFAKMKRELETPDYYKDRVVKNYILKGPVLEWYIRSKLRMEKNYASFHRFIPHWAKVVDLGCGLGQSSLILALLSEEREVLGMDHDEEKLRIARECPSRPENLEYRWGDLEEASIPDADVFIFSDVLHYMPQNAQKELIGTCIGKLREGGRLLIRDGDKGQEAKHRRTKWTEIFSTRSGFNKSKHPLEYLSRDFLQELAEANGMQLEIHENSQLTSNTLFVMEEKRRGPAKAS